MASDDPEPKRSWTDWLTRPFGRPIHPLLGSIAVGCWAASLAFDAVSRVSDTEFVYVRGAYLLTALGVAAAVVASLVGLSEILRVERDTDAFRTGVRHLLAMDVALVLFTVSFLVRRTAEFRFHDPTSPVATGLTVVGLLALGLGLWHGSRLVHVFGVGSEQGASAEEADADEPELGEGESGANGETDDEPDEDDPDTTASEDEAEG